jgi:hypothetical protein
MHTPANKKLCIPSLKGFQVGELDDILYAEAEGGLVLLSNG